MLLGAAFAVMALAVACGDDDDDDDGGNGGGNLGTVQPARATWNTGYFQEALYSRALEELGYTVEDYQELDNPLFYNQVAIGEVDFWANGWFPAHNQYEESFGEGASIAGTVIPGGALQGYLVDAAGAEEFGITSLEDFTRDEVKEAYDTDGDGLANLTACPEGWGCNTIIGHHLEAFGLTDHINEGTAGYNVAMADTYQRFESGEHVFFYTWTPNWTVDNLVPGEDVVWINVPGAEHPEGLSEEELTISGSDIQVVANNEFLEENPMAAALFGAMELTLADVAEQNAKMNAGEDSQDDIERHVDEWIEANQDRWDSWLEEARAAGDS
jgi:glycine betaine/proline transport system substrate-binding protein